MKPEDRRRLKQDIGLVLTNGLSELEKENRKLRLELHTLRFKEAQENRFIFWVYNVYSRNVCDLIYTIMGATTYDTEGEAKDGKYALPKHCFDLIKRIDEYTEHIYDGTLLDIEMSTEPSNSDVSIDVKTGQSVEIETCSWIQEDDPEICYWKTRCGNSFYFTEGTPADNRMKYCCYCGKLLKQED